MMRSLFSGISGLKGFQGSMDVIGNNISNVNTVGFKASRTTFQSMLLQTMIGAKAPDEGGRGGVNSLQIGLGAQIASVDKMMTQGSFQNTGSKTDLSISGDGFFVLSDGIQKFYSRAGNLSLDEKGNFVQPTTGLKLQGWIASIDAKTGKRYIDTDKPVADLFVTAGMTMAAKATVNMDIAGNLSAQTGIEPVTITVQNPNDTTKTYKVRFTFEKVPPFNTDRLFSGTSITYTWKAEIVDWNASSPNEIPELDSTIGRIELDQFGQIVKFEKYATNALFGMIDTSTGGLTFDSSIIDGDSVRTWFNYSPSGSAAITLAVRDLFDPDQDKVPNKILTGASLKLKASLTATVTTGEYLFTPPPTSAGQTTSIRLHESVSPATGDKLTVSYFTQEDLAATSSKTQYRITGPIVDIVGANDITEVDMVVRLSDGAGNFSTAVLTAGTQYTYDANTGTVTIIDTSALSGSSKIRIEYKTQESFIGDGTRTEFQLSKRMINKPPSLTAILTADAYLDLNFVLKEEYGRMEFRKNYPTTGFFENYTIKYADPSNPTDFDVVNVKVSNATKASVSIPKTGKIKFFDKNDTQNYALGSYIAPKYTTTVQVYDSLGKAYNLSIEFQKISTNKWAWRAIEESGMVVSFVDDKERVYTP
ncbi:MAG TPA: flagellar hook-basal body complex protein, partial [Thermotogota bacterium]|nr:flagellar hook-basal body complex protein [Thermotogota bacterium]